MSDELGAAAKTTKEDVFRKAWAACDTFRGLIDAAEYKDYILVTLFWKYISDVWHEHYDEYRKRVMAATRNGFAGAWSASVSFCPRVRASRMLWEQRDADNLGELIDIALDAIEDANKAKLEGVFRNISFNSAHQARRNQGSQPPAQEPARTISSNLDLRPKRLAQGDIIGDAYIYLIERFASDAGKKAGEFYTPRQVSPRARQARRAEGRARRSADPACGSGSLLIEAAQEVGSKDVMLYGQEVNGGTPRARQDEHVPARHRWRQARMGRHAQQSAS